MTAAVFGASGGIGAALARELVNRGHAPVHVGARSPLAAPDPRFAPFTFDLTDEASIAAAATAMRADRPECTVVATGALTLPGGRGPEKSLRQIDGTSMADAFALNAIGPALVAKHILPILPRERRSVFAVLSARVGSIGDNRLGGWHSYRASKAALNMLLKNFAIELARTHPYAVIVGLHPGTVDTLLSAPFQANVAPEQLFTPQRSAAALLDVIDALTPADSGQVFDWRGARIEP